MAALLRHGARRIGGSVLQRTQAAVAEERRRLMPRRLTTDARAPEEITRDIKRKQQELADAIAEGRRTLTASTNWRDCNQRPSRQVVQQKKEELYDALSMMGTADGKKSLKDVSNQVSPTPGGFNWREIPFESVSKAVAKICNGVIKGGLLVAVAAGLMRRPDILK